MFKKNDFNLKKDFRKLLLLTDSQYQARIKSEEQRTIMLMWSKIVGDNECITVIRFQKQGYRLGIKVTTTHNELGYVHEIVNIADKSCVSKVPGIQSGDILLEVNGVNLFLLNYNQLARTLGGLPNNIQFVIWKKEGEGVYERPDNGDISSSEDAYHLVKDPGDTWRSAIRIIVQGSRSKSHGLEFLDNNYRSRNSSRCVIQKISQDGYFFDDRRVAINDSILELNGTELWNYSDREMRKIFSGAKRCALSVSIRKYQSFGCNSDATSVYGSKFSLGISSKDSLPTAQSTPNLNPRKSFMKSLRISNKKQTSIKDSCQSEPSLVPRKDQYETVTVILDESDDLKFYLVDVQKAEKRICIIYGFHPHSSLRKKFQFKDQIIKVNEKEVLTMPSKEIGHLLKTYIHNKQPVVITVSRKSKADIFRSNESLIAPSEILTTKSDTAPSKFNSSCGNITRDFPGNDVCYVTLHKQNNSFGLRISDQDGPTIVEIISGSVAEKSGLVKLADKIIKINDIYVMDKEQNFVLTMIRSCGDKINIELLRKSSPNSDIQFMENQTYFCSQYIDSSISDHCYDSKPSISLPLPPVPENDLQ